MHVLRAEANVGDVVEQFADGGKGGERRAEDNFSVGEPADFLDEVGDKDFRLGVRFVHFPIAGDDFFAVDHKGMGLSLKRGFATSGVPEAEDMNLIRVGPKPIDNSIGCMTNFANRRIIEFRHLTTNFGELLQREISVDEKIAKKFGALAIIFSD